MIKLITRLQRDFPDLSFQAGQEYCWSPEHHTIMYPKQATNERLAHWSLLHELGHAELNHSRYNSDLELLLLEVAAWHKARELAKVYGFSISDDHIQDCLDTYRDWLHQRSTCPTCGNQSLQQDARTYRCFNCQTSWTVTASRFCRPYRRMAPIQKTSPASHKKQAMFR